MAIIRALYESVDTLKPVEYTGPVRRRRPRLAQEIHRPPSHPPEFVHATVPHYE